MKKVVSIFYFLPLFCFAQKDSAIAYSQVVKVDSTSKDALFMRARDWFNNTFKDSKEVLQIQDKENGEISGKGIISAYVKHKNLGIDNSFEMKYNFKITVWVKDNKYKYEITDIYNISIGNDPSTSFGLLTSSSHTSVKWPMIRKNKMDEYYLLSKQSADSKIKGLVAMLESSMSKNYNLDF